MTFTSNRFFNIIQKLEKRLPWRVILILAAVVLLVIWILYTPDGLMGKADAIGYAVCHRIDLRSFYFGERQIPLCARCTGQYLGAVVGFVFLNLYRPRRTGRPPWSIIAILMVFLGIYALDGINSYLHLLPDLSRFYLYNPSNLLRLITGTGLGIGISVMIFPAFNETVWKIRDSGPVVEGFKDFGIMLALGGLVDLLVLMENPIILYPLALLSAFTVLLLLTIVYTMVFLMLFRKENRFNALWQLVLPLTAGFTMALTQVAILDILRFLLTGSWDGFHIG
jgi:uncharacterized membrane protein